MVPEQTPKPDPVADSTANVTDASVGIVVSDWNSEITSVMLEGAIARLKQCGVEEEDIYVSHVPGAFELPFAARQMAIIKEPSAVIVLGNVMNDGSKHFDTISASVSQAIANLNMRHDIPFIFGVLMSESAEQALTLCGGNYAYKGADCATTALKMVNMMANMINS